MIRGDDVIDCGEGAVGKFYPQAHVPQHSKSLRAGDFVDEVGANEKLCLAVGECADRVGSPDLFKEILTHDVALGKKQRADKLSSIWNCAEKKMPNSECMATKSLA